MFQSAGSLLVGRGAVAQVGPLIVERLRARRVLVVTDAVLVRVGVVERVLASLQSAGVEGVVFEGGQPEPSDAVVNAAVAAGRGTHPEAVVGVGGGSNLDVAKLTALVLAHGGRVQDFAGEERVPGPVLPVVALPTTAGTGSEVSPAAVFTDPETHMKVSCLSHHLRPALAIVDPALTESCPPQVTADAGIDALAHAVEAFTACPNAAFQARPGGRSVYQGKNPASDVFAVECVRLVAAHLEIAVRAPTPAARDGLARAATFGGLAFANAGVALCHALEYPVGAAVPVSHGAGNGLLLPHVMRFNQRACPDEMATLAALLNADSAADAVHRLARSIGIPERLRDLGVTRDQLPGFADKAFALKRLLRTNPRHVSDSTELLAIYEAAF